MNNDGLDRYLTEGSELFALLSYLIHHKEFDYPSSELVRETGISRGKMDNMLRVLLKYGIVEKSRRIGNSDLYWTKMTGDEITRRIELITGQRWVVV